MAIHRASIRRVGLYVMMSSIAITAGATLASSLPDPGQPTFAPTAALDIGFCAAAFALIAYAFGLISGLY